MSPTAVLIPEIPSEAEAVIAKETKDILVRRLGRLSTFDMKAFDLSSEPTLKIPASAARLLVQILDEMSRGNAVKIVPVHAELTTQEAADLLNVSRPTLIQMLEEGKIPFRKVGTHRRVRMEKLMQYKRQLEADRRAALAELVAYDQEIGL
jgi:excisionase family DNA binding protein